MALAIWPAKAPATPPAVPLGPSDTQCRVEIANAVAKTKTGTPARTGVPAACWRIGPLSLGLPAAALDHILGRPEETAVLPPDNLGSGRPYHSRIYAFPRHWRAELARQPRTEPRLRFLEVLLRDGRVVAIFNDPPGRIDGGAPCRGPVTASAAPARSDPADFRPFETLLGVSVGAPAARLAVWFGTPPAHNRSDDWLNYLPVPLTFGRDVESGRITGFAIGLDQDAVTREAGYHITLTRDPATCVITGATFRA